MEEVKYLEMILKLPEQELLELILFSELFYQHCFFFLLLFFLRMWKEGIVLNTYLIHHHHLCNSFNTGKGDAFETPLKFV